MAAVDKNPSSRDKYLPEKFERGIKKKVDKIITKMEKKNGGLGSSETVNERSSELGPRKRRMTEKRASMMFSKGRI